MGSWTDKLAKTAVGGFFLESEDGSESKDKATKNGVADGPETGQAKASPMALRSSEASAFIPTVSYQASNVDPEIKARIQQIADQTDQVSYTKFMQLLDGMKNSFSDEASLYKAAFAAGKAFGLPASEVLRGADAILGDLASAEAKFKEAAPQRVAVKVSARRQNINRIKQSISSKQAEMARIQESLVRLNSEVKQLSQEEQAEQAAIAQDEAGVREDVEKFSAALEAVKAPYLAERQKLELYGRGV